jgi:addiction module HigA family antidote
MKTSDNNYEMLEEYDFSKGRRGRFLQHALRAMVRDKARRPSAPGDILRRVFLGKAGLAISPSQLAKRLGVTSQYFGAILNGKRAITPTMAMRLERVLGVDAQTWLNLQVAVDIYAAKNGPEAKQIAKLKPLRVA